MFKPKKPKKPLGKLEKILHDISIIDNFSLEEFNINNSFYKIYYYGNPKKLSKEAKELFKQLAEHLDIPLDSKEG